MEMMKDKRDSFVKSTLTKHITKFSDQRAIELLIDRVKKILAKKEVLICIMVLTKVQKLSMQLIS